MNEAEIAQWIPSDDFRFSMKLLPGNPDSFFQSTVEGPELLGERRQILKYHSARHFLYSPGHSKAHQSFIQSACRWAGLTPPPQLSESEHINWLGEHLEPDFLILTPGPNHQMFFRSGCVCFPSGWAPESKKGLGLEAIHGLVPGLNESIGKRIHTFLARMQPGSAWCRANWGISVSCELNQHPCKGIPGPNADTPPESLWLRIEKQIFTGLSGGSTVLFGIRLHSVPLALIANHQLLRNRLYRLLKSMPEDLLTYKRIREVRPALLDYLGS